MKWYIQAIKQYATFTGRTSRQGYWMFVLFNVLFSFCASILDKLFGTEAGNTGVLSMLYSLFILVPSYAISVRRLHDIGKSGMLLLAVIIATIIVTLFFIFFVLVRVMTGGMDNLSGADGGIFFVCVLYYIAVTIWLLVLYCKKGTPGVNKYGPNPEEPEDAGYDTMGESI